MNDDDEVLMRVAAAPARRIAGTAMLVVLGALVAVLSLRVWTDSLGAGVSLMLIAALALLAARWFWWASGAELCLTRTALYTSTGVTLAEISEITVLDRGIFAFRPSGGVLIRLARPHGRAYAPGLYWRFGRNLGIGGTLGRAQTRVMADMITTMITKRDKERR